MGMKITITIPDSVYAKLEADRGSVPRSTYIQDLIKCFGGAGNVTPSEMVSSFEKQGGVIPGVGTMPEPKKETTKVDEEWLYEDLIAKIGESMDRDVSYDERAELHAQVKEAGLVWNTFLKRLEKFEEGKVKIIHQY